MKPDLQTVDVEGPEGPLRLAFTDWGEATSPRTIVCVHGLTRNARDFDALARALAERARVLCVDVPGRGRSDWFKDPDHYRVPVYAPLMERFLDRLGLQSVDWIGTSLGALIGILIAARDRTPIARLVLNDIGPTVPNEALEMIRTYLGRELTFETLDELEQHLRLIHAGFGPLDDAAWRHLAIHSSRQREDGRWILSYDPAIRMPFATQSDADYDEWDAFAAIRCPTLVLRGKQSLVLTEAVFERMQRAGPRPEIVEFEGIGHAPTLSTPDQVEAIRRWLFDGEST